MTQSSQNTTPVQAQVQQKPPIVAASHKQHTLADIPLRLRADVLRRTENKLEQTLQLMRQKATAHPTGYDFFHLVDLKLFGVRVFEALIFWLPNNVSTLEHDHQLVLNVGLVIKGFIEEKKFRVTRGRLELEKARKIAQGKYFLTAPFQIHELVGLSESIVFSCYLFGKDY